ncbi:IS200/IS605 family transposase [Longimicrobium sp.]|uniref:IS200/IS605 family transposase n=1 Tax=Longimicrobium sp. TaxID=2029185 RepID=UPI002F92E518
MREPFTQLYLHVTWATWNRAPLITPWLMEAIDHCIRAEWAKLGANVEAFGGVQDHVHLLVRFPTTVAVAELVKQVKGSSSHLVGQRLRVAFKWQGGYGAFTVSPYHVEKVRNYVLHQPEHHAAGNTHSSLELLTAEQNRAGPSAA